jgi:hypothetical protein
MGLNPVGLVRANHKLSRTFGFAKFEFVEFELFKFEFSISREFELTEIWFLNYWAWREREMGYTGNNGLGRPSSVTCTRGPPDGVGSTSQ